MACKQNVGGITLKYTLTKRQAELLSFLKLYIAENEWGPSYDEMMTALGMSSRGNMSKLLLGLEERGEIRRIAGRSRAIMLCR